jgi:hypothetical protein
MWPQSTLPAGATRSRKFSNLLLIELSVLCGRREELPISRESHQHRLKPLPFASHKDLDHPYLRLREL